MDIKDSISNFQLNGTRLIKLEIKNDFVNMPEQSEIEMSVNMGNNDFEVVKKNDIFFSNLQLNVTVVVSKKNTEKQIVISLTLEGIFTLQPNSDKEDENKFKQMLLINGNSTLYSIARSHIITASSMSLDSGNIILPMINFVKLIKLKMEEENAENENK